MDFQLTADGRVKVFVDGCYVPESETSKGGGGVGVWFNANHHLNCALEVNTKDKDNNDVELMAAQHAIDIFVENYDKEHKSLRPSKRYGKKLLIYTDSQHVVDHRNLLKACSRHAPIIQRIDNHHQGIREADKLARKGAGIQ